MIMVTGATGNIGRALLDGLGASGAGPVRGLTRDAARARLPAGVEVCEGDFADPASLAPALDGARALFLVSRIGSDVSVAGIGREEARRQLAAVLGAEAADAVLDLTGGDVNDELLAVRDTVERVTGSAARPFHHWVSEHLAAFR
ncbi:SDR family oxidoreductase [Kitasatospora sp. NPDC056783]|uniref:SDR family oxidoreductase n=1 Tax=Kitasatospora sp. NPDC056783 TaxID=3345943 RepID=UPI00367AE846